MATEVKELSHKYAYAKDKASLLARMKKIEGQSRGIARMIEGDRYCIDIVQQLTALSSAVDEVELKILESHIEGCVAGSIRGGENEKERIRELMAVFRKAMKR